MRDVKDRLVPRRPHASGVAGRLAGRLLDLADQVRRLDPPGRHDPERFRADRQTEIAARLAELAGEVEVRLGGVSGVAAAKR